MHRLINDDAVKNAQSGDPRAPKEAAGGGMAIKLVLAVALFAVSGYVLYVQGVFGGGETSTLPKPAAVNPEQAKKDADDLRRAEQISRERQKAVEEGRAPKPITSQNN